jgi:hypothetical protein
MIYAVYQYYGVKCKHIHICIYIELFQNIELIVTPFSQMSYEMVQDKIDQKTIRKYLYKY